MTIRHAGDSGALVRQQELGNSPAHAFLTHQILQRYPHIGEIDLVKVMMAVNRVDRPHLDTRCFHINQQERNPLLLLDRGVGSNQTEHHVRPVGLGRPDLLAIHQIMVFLALGTRLE